MALLEDYKTGMLFEIENKRKTLSYAFAMVRRRCFVRAC